MPSLINRSIKALKMQKNEKVQGQRPPYWEGLLLIANYLEPKDLAIASCVSKSWYVSMASDHIWQPICTACYPSISNLIKLSDSSLPYHRLYAIVHVASESRVKTPSGPRLSLGDLIFDFHIYVVSTKKNKNNHNKNFKGLHLAKPVSKIGNRGQNGVFRFHVDVEDCVHLLSDVQEPVKITWNVALRGWRAVFTMMDSEGKVGAASPSAAAGGAAQGWFSEELPSTGCRLSNFNSTSGISADVKLELCNDQSSGGGFKVDKVSVGMLDTSNWRYVSVDDGLRYLQEFLLPCSS